MISAVLSKMSLVKYLDFCTLNPVGVVALDCQGKYQMIQIHVTLIFECMAQFQMKCYCLCQSLVKDVKDASLMYLKRLCPICTPSNNLVTTTNLFVISCPLATSKCFFGLPIP